MPLLAPVFREINHSRIVTLNNTLSFSTIAAIINDETGTDVTGPEVAAYFKLNALASDRMLVSKSTMQNITQQQPVTEAEVS